MAKQGEPDEDDRAWHAMPVEAVAGEFGVDPETGLADREAEGRRETHGANRLTPQSGSGALARLGRQFNNLFIYLLLSAGVITAVLGEWIDSGVIFAVVVIIAFIGFVQEGRAERALEAVRGMLAPRSRVLRGGRRREVEAENLVPGDLVLLEPGDRVPADLRVAWARNLQAQEAALTGESTAVHKQTDAVDRETGLADRVDMLYMGTTVTAGRGRGIVVAIGDDTEIGRISGMLSEVEALETPLMRRLDAFTRLLSMAILGLALVSFGVGVLVWERDVGEMLLAAVTIAVAAIPEGLPAVMTVTLAIGVRRMARRNAIVRRLPAVETLGSVTTVCSDKTGTLTRNEMTAKTLSTGAQTFEVEGIGYEPAGRFLLDGEARDIAEQDVAAALARTALLCNDASVHRGDDGWQPEGDPTEVALVVLAMKAGLDPDAERDSRRRLDLVPFESERRYMATLNEEPDDGRVLHVKGAPEQVIGMCRRARADEADAELDAAAWHGLAEDIAARGQRVLALAQARVGAELDALDDELPADVDLELLGLVGLIDPPRDEAVEAVAVCQAAGIRVKMITGDHLTTAAAVARKLGLSNPDKALAGAELDELDDEALRGRAMEVDVFARASPQHKLRLVEALQAQGEVTAMTGDGVNDAPALKRADIGIAMGRKGTDAAREASAMVLADDNFASIEQAVEEGRTVYDNIKKAILFLLPTNAAEAGVIMAAMLAGLALPITPVQILWVNMVTAVTLGIAFAWERPEGALMQRPPRSPQEPLLTGFMIWRIFAVGLLLLAGLGVLFLLEQSRPDSSLEFARTVAITALVLGEAAYLLNARFFTAPSYTRDGLTGNRVVLLAIGAVLVLQLLFIYLPFMQELFGTEALDARAWLGCLAVAAAVFVLVELEKAFIRSRGLAG